MSKRKSENFDLPFDDVLNDINEQLAEQNGENDKIGDNLDELCGEEEEIDSNPSEECLEEERRPEEPNSLAIEMFITLTVHQMKIITKNSYI